MREAAQEIAELAESEFGERSDGVVVPDEVTDEFWKTLADYILRHVPDKGKERRELIHRDPAMVDEEARRFEDTYMEFGKYHGDPLTEVPLEYLDWLDAQPDFRRQLNRYLRNPTVMKEPREDD